MPCTVKGMTMQVLIWILVYLLFFFSLFEFRPAWVRVKGFFTQSKQVAELRKSVALLSFLQELLESGQVPEPKDWTALASMPKPWGKVVHQSLLELRNQGASILPTLARLKFTIEEQVELIQEARVKSSQAFGQAMMGVILIPLAAFALYFLLPGIQASSREFYILTLIAIFLGSISFVWMISMMEEARYAHLPSEKRSWLVSVPASLERLMAMVGTGLPADLAWKQMIEDLILQDPHLAQGWKAQIWDADSDLNVPSLKRNEAERMVIQLGTEVRRSIQTSLVEGRGCLDRLESIHRAFILDLKMKVNRDLNLLPNRCLKPLFICVFPAVFGLLVGSIFLSIQNWI